MEDIWEKSKAEAEIPPTVRTILARVEDPYQGGLGRSVKGIFASVSDWPNKTLLASLTWVSDEYRKADSKLKPGQAEPDHRRGELATPAHFEQFWWVSASCKPLRLAFVAGWKEGATPKGGRSFTFVSAHCADPIGIPTELFVDYSIGEVKQVKDEPKWAYEERAARLYAEADARDHYNTGTTFLNRRPVFKAFKDFQTWLDEANEMIAATAAKREENAA